MFKRSVFAVACMASLLMSLAGASLAIAPPTLDGYLDAAPTMGAPFALTLTVTNNGSSAATNVMARAWDASGAVLVGPEPASVATLAINGTVTFVWTATPSGVGTVIYSATATEDGSFNVSSAELTATVTVAPVASPAPVDLGSAAGYVILAKDAITDTTNAATITGNIGLSPTTGAAIGVYCQEMTGQIVTVDAAYVGSGLTTCVAPGPGANKTLVDTAVADMGTAYTTAAGVATSWPTELYGGDLSGRTLATGVYKWSTSVLINTDVTLAGSATDVWIFQISGDQPPDTSSWQRTRSRTPPMRPRSRGTSV